MKKNISILLAVIIIFSCGNDKLAQEKNSRIFKDGLGRNVFISENPQRIITLCPSQTETILNFIDPSQLVAITTVCDYPEEPIKNKPRISAYPLDFEGIIKLKPDLVVSLKGMINQADIAKLEKLGVTVFVQKVDSLRDITLNYKQFGEIFGKKTVGDSIAQILESRFFAKYPFVTPKTFVFVFSVDPIYVFGEGSFTSELFEKCSFDNIVKRQAIQSSYPIISKEYILEKQPDFVFFTTELLMQQFMRMYPEFNYLEAYKRGHFIVLGEDICSRPTSRLLILQKTINSLKK